MRLSVRVRLRVRVRAWAGVVLPAAVPTLASDQVYTRYSSALASGQ